MLGCNRKTNYTRSSDTRESYPPSDSSRSIAFNSLLKENVDERKFTTERRENSSDFNSCFSASSSRLDLSYQILDYLSKDAEPRSGLQPHVPQMDSRDRTGFYLMMLLLRSFGRARSSLVFYVWLALLDLEELVGLKGCFPTRPEDSVEMSTAKGTSSGSIEEGAWHGPVLCYLIEIRNTLPRRHLPSEPARLESWRLERLLSPLFLWNSFRWQYFLRYDFSYSKLPYETSLYELLRTALSRRKLRVQVPSVPTYDPRKIYQFISPGRQRVGSNSQPSFVSHFSSDKESQGMVKSNIPVLSQSLLPGRCNQYTNTVLSTATSKGDALRN
ncbi:hypothetical protein V6N13_034899 [Hibiscus sabdariffa]